MRLIGKTADLRNVCQGMAAIEQATGVSKPAKEMKAIGADAIGTPELARQLPPAHALHLLKLVERDAVTQRMQQGVAHRSHGQVIEGGMLLGWPTRSTPKRIRQCHNIARRRELPRPIVWGREDAIDRGIKLPITGHRLTHKR